MRNIIERLVVSWCTHRGTSEDKCKQSIDMNYLDMEAKKAEEIYRLLRESSTGRLVVFKAPTGAGKTEIMFSVFARQWLDRDWFACRVYWVEPLHALLRQMRERIDLYRGKLNLGIRVDEDHGEVWEPAYLYKAPVTLTTIDTLVYGFVSKRVQTWVKASVKTGRYTLPTGLIMNSLVIFDEAHLVQDEFYLAPRVLLKILCSVVKSGGLVILSSATMPTHMISLFRKECGDDLVKELELDSALKRELEIVFEGNRKIEEVVDSSVCKGKLMIIVNTIERAQRLYKEIKKLCGDDAVFLLHSLMTRGDRERVYRLLSERDRYVLIGTQVLEVGLDLDVDRLYTELSHIDSLIQRIGRVGRRSRRGEVWVFEVEDKENPYPYMKEIVNKTRELIGELGKTDLSIASRVVGLVDKVYTEDIIEKLSERGQRLYARSLEYLTSLHIFSYPPEETFYLRPSTYRDIALVDEKTCAKTGEKIIECDLDAVAKNSIRFSIPEGGGVGYARERLKRLLELAQHVYVFRRRGDNKVVFREAGAEEALRLHGLLAIPRSEIYVDMFGIDVERLRAPAPPVSEVSRGERRGRKRRGRRGEGA